MEKQIITRENLKQIHDVACDGHINHRCIANSFTDDIKAVNDWSTKFYSVVRGKIGYVNGCGGRAINKAQLPSFDYFIETYDSEAYSMVIPHFKESFIYKEGVRVSTTTHGLGTTDGDEYRYYNYWMGCKYYPRNYEGKFSKI